MADPFDFLNQPSASNALAQIPKIPGANGIAPNAPALQTEPSGLEKFFDVINKPGAAEDQVAINLINNLPATQGVGDILGYNPNQGVFSNLNNMVSANPTYQPTGGDVIQALRGGADPETTMGKIAQGVGGFLLNVLNPADPLNWAGIGELTDTGRALEKAGTDVPFIKGLMEGNRSILSATSPILPSLLGGGEDFAHVPSSVSNFAGQGLQTAGDVISKIPGVEQTKTLFTPMFDKLKDYTNIATSGARNLFNGLGGDTGAKILSNTLKDASIEIGDGLLERTNPQMASYYKQQGYTPVQQASREVKRVIEQPLVGLQNKSVKDPHLKSLLSKIPTEGPTTPKLQNIADSMTAGLKETSKMRKSVGLSTLQDGYFPRQLSEARKKIFAQSGIDVQHGERVMKEFTTEQLENMKQNPQARAKLYNEYFSSGGKQAVNPHVLDTLKSADPQGASFYEDDALQSYGRHLQSTATEVSTNDALQSILKNPDLVRLKPNDWDGTGKAVQEVDIPNQFASAIKKSFPDEEQVTGENIGKFPTKVWVPQDTAHEFRNFMGMMTRADEMNKSFGALGAGWRTLTGIYKKLTLLTPLGGLHTALRDHMGNHFQSYMAKAWSPEGNAIASKLAIALHKAGDDPKKFIEIAEKLGIEHGLNLGDELKLMKAGNMFEEGFTKAMFGGEHFNPVEKAMGMGAVSKLRQTSENFSRIQHYITRRLQGYNATGAVHDVRKVLYDYVGGLSGFEKKLQNIFPWYSWSRFNIPAMVMATLKKPGRAAQWYRAKQEIEGHNGPDERALDEYVKGDPHIRLYQDPKTGKWTYLRVKGFLPIGDLEDVTSLTKFGQFLEGSLSPYIKAPLENSTNQSTFFKTAGGQPAQIEQYPGQTGSFLGMDIGRKAINLLRNVRPLNEVNRLLGSDGKPTLSPFNYGLSQTGLNMVPVDLNRSKQQAQFAFQKQLSTLKLGAKRQTQMGKPTTDIQNMMDNLKQQAYNPQGGPLAFPK